MTTAADGEVELDVTDPPGGLVGETVAEEASGSLMVTVMGCHKSLKLDDSVASVGGRDKGVTVIVPVKGVGRPGSGESVYVTVKGEFESGIWELEPLV